MTLKSVEGKGKNTVLIFPDLFLNSHKALLQVLQIVFDINY